MPKTNNRGFTIVELLIVIVVIGILAAITIVAYNGIQSRARVATLQSDLNGAVKTLGLGNVTNGTYAASVTSAGLRASTGTSYQYTFTSSTNDYCLTASNSDVSYTVSSTNTAPTAGLCPGHSAVASPYTFNTLTWTSSASSALITRPVVAGNYADIDTSQDGQIVVVAVTGDFLYRSINGGLTWTPLTAAGIRNWTSMSMSNDGQRIAAVATNPDGFLYTSTDAGQTWTINTSFGSLNWQAVETSASGTTMVAGWEIGDLYLSTDSGATWSNVTTSIVNVRFQGITITDDGQNMWATARCGSNSGLARSQTAGINWTFRVVQPTCASRIATTGDGGITIISSALSTFGLAQTSDNGVTWTDWSSRFPSAPTVTTPIIEFSMSSNGNQITALNTMTKVVFVSKDAGVLWTSQSTNTGGTIALDAPRRTAVSADGGVMYVVSYNAFFKGTYN